MQAYKDYQNLICWLFNTGKFLKKDMLGNITDKKKTALLSLKKQLRFEDFCALKKECLEKEYDLLEIFMEMENWANIKNNTDFNTATQIFINNKKK